MTSYSFSTQCQTCRHFQNASYLKGDMLVCAVYPEGIPDEILSMKHDHRKPFKGDKGQRYEPVSKEALRVVQAHFDSMR